MDRRFTQGGYSFGRTSLNSPQHPAPEVPTVSEGDWVEMLPPQQLNVAKHYTADQVAIAAAISAAHTDVLLRELNSPSVWFQQRAAKEVGKRARCVQADTSFMMFVLLLFCGQ